MTEGKLKKAKHVISIVIAVLIIIVVFQNTETVNTKILFTTISMPRAALLFVTLVIGYVLGVVTAGRWSWRKKK